jgi:hypothetical protein
MAYALAVAAGGTLIDCQNNSPMQPSELLPLMGDFDVSEALERFNRAI